LSTRLVALPAPSCRKPQIIGPTPQQKAENTSTISFAEQKALDQINKAAARTGEEFEGRATKLRQGYEQLESQLRETETLPAKVQDLSNRLQHLEGIEIGGPTKISELAKSALLANLEKYRDYMRLIGYQNAGHEA
jgi:hypothetical protein